MTKPVIPVPQRPSESIWDVAIIGGGLAGGMAAFHLARHGLKVVVFEKEKSAHHKVCGEFISGEGVPLIEEMGINLRALGATTINRFRLHGPSHTANADLPLAALGLSREVLDEAILEQAQIAGAEIKRGVIVKERLEGLESPSRLISLKTSDGTFWAKRLILATGKSDFKSIHQRSGRDSGLVGFKMHLRLKPSALKRLGAHCDLCVFDGGYGGLAPIEEGLANFCFLIDRRKLKKLKPDWDHLASHIAKSNAGMSHYLDGAEPQFAQFVTVARVPYGFLRREAPELGVYCVGDQMAVIPSLTGDGMTIALRTGLAAAASIAATAPGTMQPATSAYDYQREARSRLRTQIESAYLLHRLFKNPKLCDWATYAIHAFPQLLDFFFTSTRCQLASRESIKSLQA